MKNSSFFTQTFIFKNKVSSLPKENCIKNSTKIKMYYYYYYKIQVVNESHAHNNLELYSTNQELNNTEYISIHVSLFHPIKMDDSSIIYY